MFFSIALVALIVLLVVYVVYKVPFFSYKKVFVVLFIILIIMVALLVNILVKYSKKSNINNQNINYKSSTNQESLLESDFQNYKNKKVVVVGVVTNVYPFIYKSKKGKVEGYNIELIKKAIRTMGKRSIIKEYSDAKSLYNALDNKEVDVIGNFGIENKESTKYKYSIKLMAPPLIIITNRLNKYKLQKPEDIIKNQEVFVQAYIDLKNYEYSNKILSESKIKVVDSSYKVIDNINKNVYKFGIIDYSTFLNYKKTHKKVDLIQVGPLMESELTKGISFVINKDSFTLGKQLDITLSFLKNNGYISSLSLKYFNQDVNL